MSNPTFKLPGAYASLSWSIPSLTESATMIGAAIIKSLKYSNDLEMIKIEGNTGFIAGWTEMKATTLGAGGTKFDTEKLTVACLHGEHASLHWPHVGDVVTLGVNGPTGSALANTDAPDVTRLIGDWKIVKENSDFSRKQEAEKGFELERYCDVDLTP